MKHMRKRGKLTTDKTHDGRTVQITPAQWLLGEHLSELEAGFCFEYPFFGEHGEKWRFDIADTENSLFFECNGGKWHGGHRRGDAIEKENDKLNTATVQGWRVLQFTNEQILDGRAKEFLKELYGGN